MKSNKKIIAFIFAFVTFFNNNALEWDIEEEFLDGFGAEIANFEHAPTRAITTNAALTILVDPDIKAAHYFKSPLWFFTHPFYRRDIIDDIAFNFPLYKPTDSVSIIPFYNQTSQMQFVRDRRGIKEYVNLDQRFLSKFIDDEKYPNIDIPRIMQLFEETKIQERRLGFMFQHSCIFNDSWNFSWHIPVLYQEHNYFLNAAEVKAIEEDAYISTLEQGDYWDFVTNYLLSDKFGIGDLRASLEKNIKESSIYKLNIGIDITLPIAFSFKKGVIGTHFDKTNPTPSLNLTSDFLDPFVNGDNTTAYANGETLSLAFVRRANSIMLDTALGNNKHLGAGLFTRSSMIFSPTVELTSKMRLNILFPGEEQRFILKKQSNSELDAIQNRHNGGVDANFEEQDLQRLETIFIETLFPESYDVIVFPGFEFSSTSKLTYERKNYTWYVGADTWIHSKERFLSIASKSYSVDDLKITEAKKEYAYQTKTWIGFDKNKTEKTVWQWGSRVSFSGINDGIGDDFTLTLHFLKEF